MSEYWKSTPKYWCKHCKVFVRDTKLEKQNHEATPRHQGSLQRFIRDLHRGNEREEREKQRAKAEVDRLNGVASKPHAGALPEKKSAIPSRAAETRAATPAERKRQLAQLAEMGIAIPEEFRQEMAMAGDWQTVSTKNIYSGAKEEANDSKEDLGPPSSSIGVKKRKFRDQENEEELQDTLERKQWGSRVKMYPGADGNAGDDLDALLDSTKITKAKVIKSEQQAPLSETSSTLDLIKVEEGPDGSQIKTEDGVEAAEQPDSAALTKDQTAIKREDEAPETNVVFKKRKPKAVRQKG